MLYPGLVLVPFAFGWLGIAHTRWEMIASATLFGIGFGAVYPAFVTIILGSTDPARRARTFGSIVWAFDTGIGLGSFGIGAIGQHYGLGNAFLIAAALSCFAIPIFAVTSAAPRWHFTCCRTRACQHFHLKTTNASRAKSSTSTPPRAAPLTQPMITIIVIVVLALALVGYILMHVHRVRAYRTVA